MHSSRLFPLLFLTILLDGCRKPVTSPPAEPLLAEPVLPATTYTYGAKHSVNSDLATLGRVLFYDKNLSVNNSISCGTCHKQEFAFADNVQFHHGANGQPLKRNTPSIQGIRGFSPMNVVDSNSPAQAEQSARQNVPTSKNQLATLLFWDGRQNNLGDMVLNPVLNHNEMNMPDLESLKSKIARIPYYPKLFRNAFGDETVSAERIAFALEGFVACLDPDPQPFFGRPTVGPDNSLDEPARTGKLLFHTKYNCATCHDPGNSGGYSGNFSGFALSDVNQFGFNQVFTPMFNIGLDVVYADNGRGDLTHEKFNDGVFKVPTLRNITRTAPYMHDGRFSTLADVIDHYSGNIKPHANLSFQLKNEDGSPKKMDISSSEKIALIAFLKTLESPEFLTSPMYSDPFAK
jgi:cytochrome c peroxidase